MEGRLEEFSEKSYDLVLYDIKMPKLDGIEFWKRPGVNPDVPIIMIN